MHNVWLVMPPLIAVAFVASITPGPNNIMLMVSGTRFGLRATFPHALGVSFGFSLMLLLCFAGVGALMVTYPTLRTVMGIASGLYLLWLAGSLLMKRAAAAEDAAPEAKPMRWHEAVAFQFVNPKAWGMSFAISSLVAGAQVRSWPGLLLLILVCVLVNLPCLLTWAAFGTSARRFLHIPRVRLCFNLTMAGLLVATAASTVIDSV